jgi:hypothetical protein
VRLKYDYSELIEDQVVAWLFEHYDEEYLRKEAESRKQEDLPEGMSLKLYKYRTMSMVLKMATPVCLYGEVHGEALRDPNGDYWYQGGPLTREKTLDILRMVQHTADEINREAAE